MSSLTEKLSGLYTRTCNPTMFNCCTGYEAPDWSQFDGLEISACYDDGHGTCEPMAEEHEAAFFTVYGHFAPHSEVGGGVEALTDISTRKLAETIAERMIDLAAEQGVFLPHGISHF
jgi:hypothetical protein